MIVALKHPDGDYLLFDDPSGSSDGKTYQHKDKIKAAGGKWDGTRWRVPSVEKLSFVEKLFDVEVSAFCHMPPQDYVATASEVKKKSLKLTCWGCEKKPNKGFVKIVKVIGESVILRPDNPPQEVKPEPEDDFLTSDSPKESVDLW